MFQQQFHRMVARDQHKLAVIDHLGATRTYAELLHDINQLRGRLHAAGLCEGDVVATQLGNSIGYVALLFAMASLGLVHCPINLASSPEHRALRLDQVHAALLITEHGWVPEGLEIAGFALCAAQITVNIPGHGHALSGLMRMQETSGSTGTPKLALWRQDCLFREIMHWVECAGLDATDRYLNIHTLDGGHAVDLHVFPALLTGAMLYLGEATQVEENLCTLAEQRITVMSALPSQYLELAHSAQHQGVRLPALSNPFCGGAYLDDPVVVETERCMGVRIKRIYGSTEFGMILANFDAGLQVSCGLRALGDVKVELHVLDPAQPDIGEIVARSSHRGSGYFPLSADSVEGEAYFSGDIAQRQANGNLMPLGRSTDALLTRQGTQFAPALEGHIALALALTRVVVLVDVEDRRRAHVVIQADAKRAHDAQAKLVQLLDTLGVRAGIAALERIPLTPTGKPDRATLRKQLAALHTVKDAFIILKDLT
ncbi:class I adenylate-forming enzyme family protein [Pseudomonas fontis]|uniref:Long-chain fatty acid--CoA ligase n=1 Tax=Pseudomonas fontis TaxID=2942633 RepID=A0ABT5NZ05_9PSED|nr:class I adenylate-forming enzyme family protein [Pseudomonas fontis]MDD0976706.1 long-chain fatty acid--CoA ligase [Pseudomonas fontis]MDD0993303.1 long-chain fatty acid--CoA ligase [Pseudomonas fontis]